MELSTLSFFVITLVLQTFPQLAKHRSSFDTTALGNAGITASAIQELRLLRLDEEEVRQAITAKRSGMAEENLVRLWRIYHTRKERFTNGRAIVALRNVGTRDETILELAQRRLLNGWVEDVVAMRRVGFSDQGILKVAGLHLHQNKPIPSGKTLARLKHTGLSEEAIISLVEKGLQETDVERIEQMRRKGTDEKEIIRRFRPRP